MMEEVLLSSICDLKNGFAFKSNDYVGISNTLSCRMSSIRPGGNFDLEHNQRFLPDTYAEVYSDYLLNDGDIVIAMTDLAGDPKILGVPTIVNTGGKKLLQNQRVGKLEITDSSKVFIPYLQYALNRPSNKSYYKKFAGGGLQINVSKKDILNNSVPLPPIDQQKKIAAILDAADAYRQKTKALIEKYDELTQSLFLDMFGEKGKYKQEIIENLVTKITDGTHHTPKYTDSGVPFLRVTDLTKSNKSKKYITNEEHVQLIKRCNPQKGDVLYTKNGTIGVAKLVDWDYEFSIFVSLCLLKPKHDIINNKFLESFLNTPFALKQAMRHSKTGTITNLHLVEIKKIKIPLPEMNTQMEFVSKVNAIEQQKAQAEDSLAQAEDLFNSLLQRAFKGELTT